VAESCKPRLGCGAIIASMHHIASTLTIAKMGEDSYHFVLRSKFRQIDELIDGPKLTAMLERESLVDLSGRPVSAQSILSRLRCCEDWHTGCSFSC
jgi:hypothetical protein